MWLEYGLGRFYSEEVEVGFAILSDYISHRFASLRSQKGESCALALRLSTPDAPGGDKGQTKPSIRKN